jgi:hypothetical protein
MGKLRLVARANVVVAELESHLQLRSFKAAQFFREAVVAITQCFTERRAIGGGLGAATNVAVILVADSLLSGTHSQPRQKMNAARLAADTAIAGCHAETLRKSAMDNRTVYR